MSDDKNPGDFDKKGIESNLLNSLFPYTKEISIGYLLLLVKKLKVLTNLKNPVFEHADARFFLALKDGKIVGRVAAIVNKLEIEVQKVPRMRFGWIDFIDDLEVSKALLDKVQEIGIQENLEFMEGPLGFSNLDKVGVLD